MQKAMETVHGQHQAVDKNDNYHSVYGLPKTAVTGSKSSVK